MSMMTECNEISDYIGIVRSGAVAVCAEQLKLCEYVEFTFETEKLRIDSDQLQKYLNLQKYFPYRLLPWELFCFTLHNCVYREDGQLRWPKLFILVGRGAGKNGYLAFEDFCLLTPINGVKYYNIDIFAMAEKQAKATFEDIYHVLEDNASRLSKYWYWTKEEIVNLKTKSKLTFHTSGIKSADGGRPGKIDHDEYHAYEGYKLVSTTITGLGKKAHPRRTIISTNGNVRGGPLDDMIKKSERILNREIPDNGFLPFICKLDDIREIHDKRNWDKANPSLRYFPTLSQELESEYEDYVLSPIENSDFATKRMNMPQGNKEQEVTSWDNIMAANRPLPDLTGQTCVVGIDYANTNDFVAAGLLFKFEGVFYWIQHTWVCTQSADLHRIHAPLDQWAEMNLLEFVDDVEISPEAPAIWLQEMADHYNLTILNIDSFRWTLLKRALNDVGFDTEKNGANNVNRIKRADQMMIAPTITHVFNKHLIVWGENPLMNWYTNNACVIKAKSGNIVYGKQEAKSRKTDGFMAFVYAMFSADTLPDAADKGSGLDIPIVIC